MPASRTYADSVTRLTRSTPSSSIEDLRALVRQLQRAGSPQERAGLARQMYASLPEVRAGGGLLASGLGGLRD